MSITLAAGRPTLADRIFSRRLATDLVLIAAGTALTSIAAQVVIPMWPVSITGQTFAVLLVGSVLGAARGAISMGLYLLLGSVGLPIFARGGSGSILGMADGGYIVGFVAAAALVGWLAQREWDHHVLKTIAGFAAGSLVIYVFGASWLYVVLGTLNVPNTLGATLTGGVVPFLVGDLIKAVFAGILLPVSWRLVHRADEGSARDKS